MAASSAMWAGPGVLELWAAAGPESEGPSRGFCSVARFCARRVWNWPVPPNWNGTDWRREVTAIADAAAHEASCSYDPAYTHGPAVYLSSRIMGQLLTRYRQEWRFARHVLPISPDADKTEQRSRTLNSFGEGRRTDVAQQVRQALDRLQEVERWLIVQIFWHQRDQAELARELGVSQPAISKRYRHIVHKLRLGVTV